MDPGESAPKPFQQPEKPGRVRRRKTRRERNESLAGSRQPLAYQHPPVASRDPHMVLRNSVAPTAAKLVVITQGRLSRDHRGLFSHEVKSLDVARLLSSESLESGTPALTTIACLSTLDPQASFQAGSIGPEGGSAETWLQRSHPSRLAVHLGWALSALCTVASEAFLGCQCSPSLWGLLGGLSASSPQQSGC